MKKQCFCLQCLAFSQSYVWVQHVKYFSNPRLNILYTVFCVISDPCASKRCPSGWTQFGTRCYRFWQNPQTWTYAGITTKNFGNALKQFVVNVMIHTDQQLILSTSLNLFYLLQQHVCHLYQANLVSIKSEEEKNFLRALVGLSGLGALMLLR